MYHRVSFILLLAASSASGADEADFLQGTRQLTFAGARAGEGYFSADGTKIVFQSEREPKNPFFQIYLLDLETGDTERISTGVGKTTCAWLHPGSQKVMFASTHADPSAEEKQAEEIEFRNSGKERRYSWDYDPEYEIWAKDLQTNGFVNLTNTRGYDAEGAYSPDGEWIVFASNRQAYSGELPREGWAKFKLDPSWAMEIYRMRSDGSDVQRLTSSAGYDGGPFFSADGSRICWRRFSEDGATAEIWTMNANGTDQRQLTRLGAMSWAPFFHPSGDYLIFATNLNGFSNFELYVVDADGAKEPVRITTTEGFDGLPAFSPQGDRLSWTSNRTPTGKSQLFLAEWNDAAARDVLGLNRKDSAPRAATPSSPAIDENDLRRHVEALTAEEMAGRLTGTEGERIATAYAAEVFASLGLEPAGDDGGWFQTFEFTAGVDLGDSNSLKTGNQTWEAADHWLPLSFSKNGNAEGAGIVFAGYGIEAPPETDADGREWDTYTSYAHTDLTGKWVMVFRYMPEDIPPEARQRLARFASLRHKAMIAREKGAIGLIVVSGPRSGVENELVPLRFDASLAGSGISAISISDKLAQSILDQAGLDLSLEQLQIELDKGESSGGTDLGKARIEVTVDVVSETKTGRNVIARLPSGQPDAKAVLVGAHIDHLGDQTGPGSRADGEEESLLHHGADDNASGTAAVFEIAELFASQVAAGRLVLKRDVVFAAWSGEELGLIGSSKFAEQASSTLPENASLNERYVAALNMDMIGRLNKSLVLQGVGSSDFWPGEIERRNAVVGLPITVQQDCFLPTDATSFYLKGVPILNAFTGAHEDYHRPSDTADKINYPGTTSIAKFMSLVARGLATTDAAPEFNAMREPQEKRARASLRAYLGTIPDYAQGKESGVKLSGVAKGGPAAKAGVKSGDVIVSLASRKVANIYDYTYVIEALKIGDEVPIIVERGGERVSLKITPGSRD